MFDELKISKVHAWKYVDEEGLNKWTFNMAILITSDKSCTNRKSLNLPSYLPKIIISAKRLF